MVQQPLPATFPPLTNPPTMSFPSVPAPMVGISAGDATTNTSSLTTSLEEIKRAQEEVRAQQVAYQHQRESDREELRVAQEKFTQATAEAETDQDNRREELRTSIENQMREQVRQQFEDATQGWNTTLSEQLASATSASTDQLIKMVMQQREEDQRTITAEFGKISDQIAELNKIVVVLAQQVAASTGTQLSSLIVTPAGTADDDMTEAISSAKKQKNSEGLPSAPNITALIPPRV
jgi:DNA anti-recombination protein RmuC